MSTSMRKTSVQLTSRQLATVARVAKKNRLSQSEALRLIIDRYDGLMSDLARRGFKIKEYPARFELEAPR